jgi:hypothetical protein
MTKTEFTKRLKTYMRNNSQIEAKIEKLIKSGCIDLDSKQDDWMLEKAAAYAIMMAVADDFKPLHSETIKEAKNIMLFI